MTGLLIFKNLKFKPAHTILSIVLLALGTGIISILLLIQQQVQSKLNNDLEGIDLVIGAKGSPLQLILSAVYQIDAPTGNISLAEANKISKHPLIAQTIPLAYGDSFKGFRIVGTTNNYLSKYKATIAKGTLHTKTFEVVIGSEVAKSTKLSIGESFISTHGFSNQSEDHHQTQQYTVKGILNTTNSVLDHLIITSLESIWKIHETENHDAHEHEQAEQSITALLVTYRSKMAMMLLPRQINETTNLQAATPLIEINRLTNLMGIGIETIKSIAIAIIAVSGLSIFISLYSRLQERKYELAIMRSLGASKWWLASTTLLESVVICIIGYVVGIILSRLGLWLLHNYSIQNYHVSFNQLYLTTNEMVLLLLTLLIGIVSAIIPAIQTASISISKTLSHA
jgi:putative ABC transport system permease protein